MIKKYSLIIIILSSLLQGCATPYQSMGLTGGFKNMRLSENTYQVTFSGNAYTSPMTVAEYTLRRCAELTEQNGYKYFVILVAKGFDRTSAFTTPTYINSTGDGDVNVDYNGFGNYSGNYTSNYQTTISPGYTRIINKYSAMVIMKMLHYKDQHYRTFNADIVLSNYAANNG